MTRTEVIKAVTANVPSRVEYKIHAYCVWYDPTFQRTTFYAYPDRLDWWLDRSLPPENENYDYEFYYFDGLGETCVKIEGKRA